MYIVVVYFNKSMMIDYIGTAYIQIDPSTYVFIVKNYHKFVLKMKRKYKNNIKLINVLAI